MYQSTKISLSPTHLLGEALTKFEREGWEAVHFEREGQSLIIVLKEKANKYPQVPLVEKRAPGRPKKVENASDTTTETGIAS